MDPSAPDRTLAFILRVGAVCILIAGLVAVAALASGDFSSTDGKLILTSIGFGICSAFAASCGALAGSPGHAWRRLVGVFGVGASIAAFGFLVAGLWLPDAADGVWQAAAIAGIVALWCWHAGAILGRRREDDGDALILISAVAVGALGIDAVAAIAAVSGWLERPDSGLVSVFGIVLVVAVVASVLVPILRRLERTAPPAPSATVAEPAPRFAAATARRGPSQTLQASWRDGDAATRTLLVACGALPVLAGLAVALAWPASAPPARPAPPQTLTIASPPVTVTQVPPAPAPPLPDPGGSLPDRQEPGTDFTAADASRVIVRRRRAFDRAAQRNAKELAPIVEHCFARAEDFTQCDTPPELPAAATAGLSLGMGQAQVAVVASTVSTYELAAHSRTGTTFTLARDAAGTVRRTCTPADTGDCGRDGTW